MENIRVIRNGEDYFKYADVVKVTTIDNDGYVGQIMPGEEDDLFIFELCLEDKEHKAFCENDIKTLEKADDREVFAYAFNLGQNMMKKTAAQAALS